MSGEISKAEMLLDHLAHLCFPSSLAVSLAAQLPEVIHFNSQSTGHTVHQIYSQLLAFIEPLGLSGRC